MARQLTLNLEPGSLREATRRVCELVRAEGGCALAVGGCVRDSALGLTCRDVDLEMFGLAPDRIEQVLARDFPLDHVGRSFAVIKLREFAIDVSVPYLGRRETASWAPEMTPAQAASRRDFTVNAIALNPLTDEVIDPFDGLSDLSRKYLRHTSESFGDDSLRVLRAMQLAARFGFEVAPDTITLCRTLTPDGLPVERIFGEWRKLILNGVQASRGLAFLRDCGWIEYTPHLAALIDCPQDPEWHPEGDVWIHTLHCMDAFAGERIGDEREDLTVGLAVLCHDLGKPATTKEENGRITSRGHQELGERLTHEFLEGLTDDRDLLSDAPPLVGAHLTLMELFQAGAGDAAVRRLARRVGRIDRLVRVARADQMGRASRKIKDFPAGDWLLERARALDVESAAPRSLVLGRHLIDLGLESGPDFGPILERCYAAQIEGSFETLEEGIQFAEALISEGTNNSK